MKYHKIQTVFKRDPETKFKTLLEGQWTLPEFEYLANNTWIFTEKIDGTNIRVYFDPDKGISFQGRTDRAQIPVNLEQALHDIFDPLYQSGKLHDTFQGRKVCLYGEGYGGNIQKVGKLYRPTPSFILFDILVNETIYLNYDDVQQNADTLGISSAPVIKKGNLYQMIEDAKKGIRSTYGDFEAEGYVARPEVFMQDRMGRRIITKIKCRDFR